MRHHMEYRYPSIFVDNVAFKTREETRLHDIQAAAAIISQQSHGAIVASTTRLQDELRTALIFIGEVALEFKPKDTADVG